MIIIIIRIITAASTSMPIYIEYHSKYLRIGKITICHKIIIVDSRYWIKTVEMLLQSYLRGNIVQFSMKISISKLNTIHLQNILKQSYCMF